MHCNNTSLNKSNIMKVFTKLIDYQGSHYCQCPFRQKSIVQTLLAFEKNPRHIFSSMENNTFLTAT